MICSKDMTPDFTMAMYFPICIARRRGRLRFLHADLKILRIRLPAFSLTQTYTDRNRPRRSHARSTDIRGKSSIFEERFLFLSPSLSPSRSMSPITMNRVHLCSVRSPITRTQAPITQYYDKMSRFERTPPGSGVNAWDPERVARST